MGEEVKKVPYWDAGAGEAGGTVHDFGVFGDGGGGHAVIVRGCGRSGISRRVEAKSDPLS